MKPDTLLFTKKEDGVVATRGLLKRFILNKYTKFAEESICNDIRKGMLLFMYERVNNTCRVDCWLGHKILVTGILNTDKPTQYDIIQLVRKYVEYAYY